MAKTPIHIVLAHSFEQCRERWPALAGLSEILPRDGLVGVEDCAESVEGEEADVVHGEVQTGGGKWLWRMGRWGGSKMIDTQ